MDEQTIFLNALAIESPDDRAAYLSQACAGNEALRAGVEALIAAHAKAEGFLAKPAVELAETVARPAVETAGSQIGPYKLMEKIGEGGFGQVFVAEQQQPVRRKVAIKIIKPGMDTREVIARFEVERQALALMDHPNIAKVLDAGSTDSGRPYFVMELVRGVSITDYCDQTRLNSRERLDLFVSVCQAVQHAHQKGIIHRDIKPSNVLVSLHDGRPVVKVIDFGVAKAINQQLTENTVYTKFTQLIGTPLYMSPEQAEMSGLDIDTRTDVYSLGVLLYELLTGTTPFDKRRMAKAAFDEIRRIIREDEPPKPSTRLSESGDALPSIAAKRHTEPAKLSKTLRGDLDWIVMKALEKDRTRRYETANGLARDVQRYLSDEPVEACPPSRTYRLRKFARKNKTIIATVSAFMLLLATGLVVSKLQARRAWEAEQLATERADQLETANATTAAALAESREAKTAAEKALAKSEQERLVATEVTEYLTGIFRRGDPSGDGREVKVVDAFDNARSDIDARIKDQPTKGRLLHAIGTTYMGLGISEKAIDALEDARIALEASLEKDDPATLHCVSDLAVAIGQSGEYRRARTIAADVLERRKRVLGPNDPQTLISMGIVANADRDLGDSIGAQKQLEETRNLMQKYLGAKNEYTLEVMRALAYCYRQNGDFKKAIALYEEAKDISLKEFPEERPATLSLMGDLAVAYALQGKADVAISMLNNNLKIQRDKLGPHHPDTLLTRANIAGYLGQQRKHEEAIKQYEATIADMQQHLVKNHPYTINAMSDFAMACAEGNELEKAAKVQEDVVERTVERFGKSNPNVAKAKIVLSQLYNVTNRTDKAAELCREAYDMLANDPKIGPDDLRTVKVLEAMAFCDRMTQKLEDAIDKLKEIYKIRKDIQGEDHFETRNTLYNLCETNVAAARFTEAETLLRQLLEIEKRNRDQTDRVIATTITFLAFALHRQGKHAEALATLAEGESICQKYAPDGIAAYLIMRLQGKCLLALDRKQEAERKLSDAVAGLIKHRELIPPNSYADMFETIDVLIKLLKDNGNQEAAEAQTRRRAELLEYFQAQAKQEPTM